MRKRGPRILSEKYREVALCGKPFPRTLKKGVGGHFSTNTEFWEHRAQADFIMVHGNLIRLEAAHRTDVI